MTHGLQRGQIQWSDDFSASLNNKGKWEATISFSCHRGDVTRLMPKRGSACLEEGFTFLGFDSATISHEGGGICRVTCKYGGGENNAEFTFEGQDSGERAELAISTSEEPIESHSRYVSLSEEDKLNIQHLKAGRLKATSVPGEYIRKDSGSGGAKIVFEGLAEELAEKISKGISSYLAANQIWRVTYTSRKKPSATLLNGVGKINNPAGAPMPSGGRNWLFVGAQVNEVGNGYEYTLEYRLSGPGGWDEDLYD